MSDVGKMLSQFVYLTIAIVAIAAFILFARQTRIEECDKAISGNALQVLEKLKVCVNNCWYKHDYGRSSMNEDCYVINLISSSRIERNEAEKMLSNPAKVSFLVDVQPNAEVAIRVRYNSTGVIQIIPY
jgi:hypothetical protein